MKTNNIFLRINLKKTIFSKKTIVTPVLAGLQYKKTWQMVIGILPDS
jgi:hypothetical protein